MYKTRLWGVILSALLLLSHAAYAQSAAARPIEGAASGAGQPLSGQAALMAAESKGLIRKAASADIMAYQMAEAKAKGLPDSLIENSLDLNTPFLNRRYVVLSPDFVIPADLSWVSFYVPEGLPKPQKAPGADYSMYSYDALKVPAAKQPIAETCAFPKPPVIFPAEAKVYALGRGNFGSLGSALDFYIDDHSMNKPHLMQITVNSPSEAAILMLETGDSTIWHFNWTPGTKIAAVYIEGNGKQVTSGLPADVPVLINPQDWLGRNEALCPGFSVSPSVNGLVAANDLSRHLFQRDIFKLSALRGEKGFVVGPPLEAGSRLESAEALNPYKFRDSKVPLPGPAGLEEAVTKGLIRKARPEEVQAYLKARAKAEGLPGHLIKDGFTTAAYAIHHNPYIVLSPDFIIPQHLYANDSASFIVPEGVPEPKLPAEANAKAPFAMPQWESGHHGITEAVASRIYSYADLKSSPPGLVDYKENQNIRPADTCFFSKDAADLSATAKVYAVNADSGTGLDFTLEGSPKPAKLMKIAVNSPSEPALLLLKANGPTIWHFNWTDGTKIEGVYIDSDGPQIISGLPENVPILINNLDEAGSCSTINASSSLIDLIAANNLSRRLFGRSLEKIEHAENGTIVIGQPFIDGTRLESAEKFDVNKFRDPATPTFGPEGLREAEDRGLIRKATPEDVEQYKAAKPVFPSACVLPRPVLPDKVYAIAVSSQCDLDFQIDDSGEQASLMTLTVNAPNETVALLLETRRPTVWRLEWTKGTKIAAVVVSGGRYKQVFSGLPEEVPVLFGKGDGYDLSLCPPNFEVEFLPHSLRKINGLSQHFFKRDLTDIVELKSGENTYTVGQALPEGAKLESAEALDFKKFIDPNKPLAGEAGLREAVAKGFIRKATATDIQDYLSARNKAGGLTPEAAVKAKIIDVAAMIGNGENNCGRNFAWGTGPITDTRSIGHNAYVVLSPDFVIPPGVPFPTIIVPKGMSAPKGSIQCGVFFSYDDLRPIAE